MLSLCRVALRRRNCYSKIDGSKICIGVAVAMAVDVRVCVCICTMAITVSFLRRSCSVASVVFERAHSASASIGICAAEEAGRADKRSRVYCIVFLFNDFYSFSSLRCFHESCSVCANDEVTLSGNRLSVTNATHNRSVDQ